MSNETPDLPDTRRPDTLSVRGGTMRSSFAEMSEGLFLTQGYTYESAGQAEARSRASLSISSTPGTAIPRCRCSRSGCA